MSFAGVPSLRDALFGLLLTQRLRAGLTSRALAGLLRCILPFSPLFKDHRDGYDDQRETGDVIPAHWLLQVQHGEHSEDRQRDHLLDRFQLRGGEFVRADAVCRNLEAVLEKGNHPADNDDLEERDIAVFQVTVPCEGHEDIGNREQGNRAHVSEGVLSRVQRRGLYSNAASRRGT